MGGTAIGIPDGPTNAEINALPIQSPSSVYDLRNANVALAPQPSPPPALTPDESIAELQGNATASFLRPHEQYQIPPDFQQPPFQQPQIDQSQFSPLHPLVAQLKTQLDQETQQKSQGVMKHLVTSFLGGMGRSMMVHAGLPTPEMERERKMQQLVDLANADANQSLKQIETQRYAMDIQKAPVVDPTTGKPVLGPANCFEIPRQDFPASRSS